MWREIAHAFTRKGSHISITLLTTRPGTIFRRHEPVPIADAAGQPPILDLTLYFSRRFHMAV